MTCSWLPSRLHSVASLSCLADTVCSQLGSQLQVHSNYSHRPYCRMNDSRMNHISRPMNASLNVFPTMNTCVTNTHKTACPNNNNYWYLSLSLSSLVPRAWKRGQTINLYCRIILHNDIARLARPCMHSPFPPPLLDSSPQQPQNTFPILKTNNQEQY